METSEKRNYPKNKKQKICRTSKHGDQSKEQRQQLPDADQSLQSKVFDFPWWSSSMNIKELNFIPLPSAIILIIIQLCKVVPEIPPFLETIVSQREAKLMDDRITDQNADALGYFLSCNSTLTNLGLITDRFSHVGAALIGKGLKLNTVLTSLDMCHFSAIDESGIRSISNSLLESKSIRMFNGISIGDLKDNHPDVTKISLGDTERKDQDAFVIGSLLKINSILQSLSLNGNEIGDIGAKSIAEGLKNNCTLRCLDMMSNKIGDLGAQAIAESLKHNSTLKELYLNDNIIGNVGACAIGQGLTKNKTLELFWVDGKKHTGDGRQFSTSVKQRLLNVMKEHPSLNEHDLDWLGCELLDY